MTAWDMDEDDDILRGDGTEFQPVGHEKSSWCCRICSCFRRAPQGGKEELQGLLDDSDAEEPDELAGDEDVQERIRVSIAEGSPALSQRSSPGWRLQEPQAAQSPAGKIVIRAEEEELPGPSGRHKASRRPEGTPEELDDVPLSISTSPPRSPVQLNPLSHGTMVPSLRLGASNGTEGPSTSICLPETKARSDQANREEAREGKLRRQLDTLEGISRDAMLAQRRGIGIGDYSYLQRAISTPARGPGPVVAPGTAGMGLPP